MTRKHKKQKQGHKMNFLPDNYEAPKPASNLYFKPQDGESRVRILSKPIFGWEDWTQDKKPVRFHMDEKPTKPIDPKKPIKHFWAFIVYNVVSEQIQIWQVSQATIRNSIEALCKNEEWGSPFEYDVIVSKKGEGIETEYSVLPTKPKPVSQEILKAFKDRPIQLEALFQSLDPFSTGYTAYTPLMCDDVEDKVVKIDTAHALDSARYANPMGEHVKPLDIGVISDTEFAELSELLLGCSESSQNGFGDFLTTKYKIAKLYDLPKSHYQSVKDKLEVRFKENQKALVEAEMADTPENKGKKK